MVFIGKRDMSFDLFSVYYYNKFDISFGGDGYADTRTIIQKSWNKSGKRAL